MLSIRWRVWTTFAAGAILCAGQDAGIPTFRSATTLIEFNVVALDASGKPVTDLKKEDILISERGKPRDVAYFRFDGAGGIDETQQLPAGDFSNRSDRLSSLRSSLAAIVMDTVNTAPVAGLAGPLQESNYQETTRAQILRYLHAIPPHTRAALYRLESDRVTLLQDFTDDLEPLRTRIAQIDLSAKGPPIDIGFHDAASDFDTPLPAAAANAAADASRVTSYYSEGIRDDRLQTTLAGLESLGNRLAGLPGRKSIVWLSVGLPSITNIDGWIKSHASAIQQTARKLASQGIAIYAFPVTGKYSPAMDILADTTGGRVVRTMNDPVAALSTAAADNSAVYALGFYSQDEPDNKWHDVTLSVKRPGIHVNYRQGYISKTPAAQPQDWSPDQWQTAIYNSLGSSSLRLDARCHMGSGPSAGTVFVAIRFELTDLLFRAMDNRRTAQIEIAYVEMKPNGIYNIQRRNATLNYTDRNGGSVQTERSWKLDPEAETIRVILRDKLAGRYGTLDVGVKDIPVK